MAIVTWKTGFRELTVDGWTETDNGDGSYTYTAPAPKDAEIVWSAGDRQPHPGMPMGSTIRYWPDQKKARIEKA